MSLTPSGALIRTRRPAATGLRTKRTWWVAGRSAVNRPRPRTSAGSSKRRIARPTHFIPEPAVTLAASFAVAVFVSVFMAGTVARTRQSAYAAVWAALRNSGNAREQLARLWQFQYSTPHRRKWHTSPCSIALSSTSGGDRERHAPTTIVLAVTTINDYSARCQSKLEDANGAGEDHDLISQQVARVAVGRCGDWLRRT